MTSVAGPSAIASGAEFDRKGPWIGMLSVTLDTPAKHYGTCDLCRKETESITKHHLYPRAAAAASGLSFTPEQEKSIAMMCWPCHCIVHRLLRAPVLARFYHSIDTLKTHSGIKAWLKWSQSLSTQHLRSLMISRPDALIKPPKTYKSTPKIQRALDEIWLQNNDTFPKLEPTSKKRTRAWALGRHMKKTFPATLGGGVGKPQLEAAMKTRVEYGEWLE
ncbi:hypothetical protein B0H16DRAFT_380902 [Mycena metata]|uniref:HNH domain-containing protein n=1 Tax=Mycena metata TaxID=1033252 RepID=A0AAD7MJR2_9AGAR|nr:hypothetical protein B0H16DRAFT_380902 [Mycena metata]